MMLKSFGQYSGEIFILILFAASWLLLRIEGKGLAELGFDQPVRRLGELVAGFFITGALIALMRLGSAWRSDVTWEWNSYFIPLDYLEYLVWPKVTAVLLIALVCQSYLLLLAMRFSGRTSALWLSAIAFCVCNLVMMWNWGHRLDNLSVLAPASWYLVYGFVLALAFRQTGSMAAPIGLNLGWFVVGGTVFGDFVPSFEPLVLSEGESLKEDVVSVVISFGLMIAALVSAIWLLYRPALTKEKGFRGKQAIRTQG